MFTRKVSSTTVSRAPSFSDRSSLDVERTTTAGTQAVHLVHSNRRTMSLAEDADDDVDEENPWERLRASAGPMSAVSETGGTLDGLDLAGTAEVTSLRISHMAKGCTATQIYDAFEIQKEDVQIEVLSSDEALLHFTSSERAMKAYFRYLSSTSSIGTVSPYEASTEYLSSSPVKHSMEPLRSRKSFQTYHNSSNGGMLSALTNITSWRSSDKLNTLDQSQGSRMAWNHRKTSSRSSIHSKSTDFLPGLSSKNDSISEAHSAAQDDNPQSRPVTKRAQTPLAQSILPDTASKSEPVRSSSLTKRFFLSGLGLKSSKANKEKAENGARKQAKSETSRG